MMRCSRPSASLRPLRAKHWNKILLDEGVVPSVSMRSIASATSSG